MSAAPHSSSDGGKGRNVFGRDEFAALLGGPDHGGLSEVLTRRSHATTTTMMDVGKGRNQKKKKDVSDLTVEETAALLKQQQPHHANAAGSSRLRATSHRAREYHKLLEEQLLPHQNVLLQQQQQQSVSSTMQNTTTTTSHGNRTETIDDHGDDYHHQHHVTVREEPPMRRKKAAPVILVELGITKQHNRPYQHDTTSEKDHRTKEHDISPPRPTSSWNDSNSSDDDDDDNSSVDRRRQRVLQRRKPPPPQLVQAVPPPIRRVESNDMELPKPTDVPTTTTEFVVDTPWNSNGALQQPMSVDDDPNNTTTMEIPNSDTKLLRPQRNRTSDDGRTSDSSDESTSSEDESESESEDDGIEKPVFIPKHRRTMIQSLQEETAKQVEKEQEEKECKKRRQRESRALVQESLMNAKLDRDNTNTEPFMDGITGATNEVPTDNDDDDDDQNIRYEEWEVRELERIILDWDLEVSKTRNEEERNQRRRRYAPTGKLDRDDDDDDMDVSSNRPHAKPSVSSEVRQQHTGYHHRGAFYMDDTNDNDIRQKAMDSASTVVLPDHQYRDRSMLPKVMQVKKFGFANQSKYRGLAAEDTTDKNLDILPIVHGKNRSKRFK